MIPLTALLIVVSALTLVVVVMQMMLHSSMPVARRLMFERVMMWGFRPVLAVLWGVCGVVKAIEGDILWALVSGLFALTMVVQAAAQFRKAPAADGTRT